MIALSQTKRIEMKKKKNTLYYVVTLILLVILALIVLLPMEKVGAEELRCHPTKTPTPTETDLPDPTPTETDLPDPTPTETDLPDPTPTETDLPVPTPTSTKACHVVTDPDLGGGDNIFLTVLGLVLGGTLGFFILKNRRTP
ncbi:hypothetical protein K8R20_00045 [bacterium]|nr:hypothetical protein [bacterium]